MAQNSIPPNTKQASFSQAVADAEQLLRYASSKGLAPPKEIVDKIVDSKQLLDKDDKDATTFNLQKEFWLALSALSSLTKPATVESVRFASTPERSKISLLFSRVTGIAGTWRTIADIAVGRAAAWALLGLLFVAVFQVYFEVGNTTVESYLAAKKQYATNANTITADKLELEHLKANPKTAQQQNDINKRISDNTISNDLLLAQNERNLSLIKNMLFWINWFGKAAGKDDPAPSEYEIAQRIISIMQGLIIVLRDFVLPMGWGFLGAALYVSRTLAEDIKTVAYAPERAIIYRSRYYMGMVAGFIVAKFFIPLAGTAGTSTITTTTGSSTITPLALALLVGYSVEVLFTLFDKLIAAFSTK